MSEKIDIEQVDGIGALESLTTANKSSLVNAINEVKGSVPSVTNLVPYTGANQTVNLNTQKIIRDGITANSKSITSQWILQSTPLTASNKVAYLIIDGFTANVHRQLYIEVESVAGNGEYKKLVKGYSVNFANTNTLGSQKDSRYIEVVGYYNDARYGIGEVEKHSDTALKIPLIWINSVAQSQNKITVQSAGFNVSNLTFSIEYDTTSLLTTENPYLYYQASEKWVKDNYDFRQYGLGNGLVSSPAISNDLFTAQNTGFFRYSNPSSNKPDTNNGFLINLVRTTEYKARVSLTDNGRVFFTSGGNDSNWKEFWHTGNFNPAQYVLQTSLNTQLGNYVPINGVTTINNTKTFTSSPVVPNATLDGHAVNLGQLNGAVSSVKTRIGINGSDYTDAGDINLIANSGVILNKVGNNIYIESTGTPHYSKMTNEVNFPDFTTIELNTDKHYIYCDNSYNFSEITIDVGQAKDGYELIIFCGEDPSVGQNPEIIMNADVIRPNGQEYDTILLSRGKWYRFIYFKDLDKLMLSGYGEV